MFGKYNIKEIRILIMSPELEFDSEEKVREYLRYELPKKEEGKYWYREKGIDIENQDTLVLFWYKHKAIGCGIMYTREKVAENDGVYKGILYFYPETIFNIESITEDEIHRFSDEPVKVVQGSPRVDIKALNDILDLIYKKWKEYFKN